jgi:hypothetical protein
MALQGAGTELDPFLITNLAELRTEVTDANAYYKVTQNLDVRGTQYEAEWLECTLACLQLDFDNKELKNVTTAQNNHLFRFNCTTVTLINFKLVNCVNSKALFAHLTTNYDALTNLTILNSSFSVKWYANNGAPNSTTGYGLLGIRQVNIDTSVLNLELHGTIKYVLHSILNVNRCHFILNGNIDLTWSEYKMDGTTRASYSFFKLLNSGTKIYVTGTLKVNCVGVESRNFYFFQNEYNRDYGEYGNRAYFAQCYVHMTLDITFPFGTTNNFAMWIYQTTSATAAPPASWMSIGDMVVHGGVLNPLPSEYANVYLVTKEQARDSDFLATFGFDVSKKE